MTKHKGFTLVELLVTMSLLAMIVLIGSSAFGLFGQRWDGRLGHFDATVHHAQNVLLVQDVLSSLMPYVTYNRVGKPVIYFEGNRNGFVAVSSRSIFNDEEFAVVRFSVSQNTDFSYNVLYEEAAMRDNELLSLSQPLIFSSPMILFESVTDPEFQYFGWANARGMASSDDSVRTPPQWLESYNAVQALFAPLKVSLRFSSSNGQYQIYSRVASAAAGLLSRYKSDPHHKRRLEVDQSPDIKVPQDDDCDC